jgi:hypothetical protein
VKRVISELEAVFLRGDYASVVRSALDHPEAQFEDADLVFVVGALCFIGRSEDAAALFRSRSAGLEAQGDPQAGLYGCRFFLCIGECRAGRYHAAERLCRENLAAFMFGSAHARFYLHQGLGMLHYFRGRLGQAARHAARARRFSVEAQFPFGRMLSMDLLGHSLLQVGRVQAGLALLSQSADLAESFGFGTSARTTRSAIAVYRVQRGLAPKQEIEALLGSIRDDDVYSRRLVLTGLAAADAMAGQLERARARLQAAMMLALPDDDHRGRIRLCLAHAVVDGLSLGEPAALKWLDEAQALLRNDDLALTVEIRFVEYLAAPTRFQHQPAAELAALARLSGTARAHFLTGAESELASVEDPILGVLRRARHGTAALNAIIDGQWLALIPRCFGLQPGKRIYLDAVKERLIAEDSGQLWIREGTPARTAALLESLSSGPKTKEDLLREVWKIKAYHPDRHDSVVYTTISRVRSFLGEQGNWLQATEVGYELSHVEVIHVSRAQGAEDEAPLGDSILPPALAEGDAPAKALKSIPAPAVQPTREERVLALLAGGPLSTSEIASGLSVSEMTAFRVLALLVKSGGITRSGSGKNTRYTLAA